MMSLASPFQSAAVVLLREAFEGRPDGQYYTWFVEKREGIFDALESLDSEKASKVSAGRSATAAAHAYHLLYVLRMENTAQGRPKPEGNWESTWAKQVVSPEEWDELRAEIRAEFGLFIAWFESNTTWSEDESVTSALASLPHFAYHLGALRQIVVAMA